MPELVKQRCNSLASICWSFGGNQIKKLFFIIYYKDRQGLIKKSTIGCCNEWLMSIKYSNELPWNKEKCPCPSWHESHPLPSRHWLRVLTVILQSSRLIACVAVFSVSSKREKARAKGKSRERMGREQKEEWGEGVGRKGKACSWALTFYQTPFVHEREAIRHNDWSIARQSKRSTAAEWSDQINYGRSRR